MAILVDSMISQVRDQTDESNTDDVTDAQITKSLNRAQRHATNILARRFEEMMWDSTTVTTSGGVREYDIPVAALSGRVEMVEVETSTNVRYKLQRISNHKSTNFVTSGQTSIPTHYTLKRNKFAVYPTPNGGLTLYVHYNKRAEDLVIQLGRINSIDTDNNYVIVDAIIPASSSPTVKGLTTTATNSDSGAYINIIDYNTGNVKRSLQVSALDTTTEQITFKSAGLTRATVLGHTISTTIGSEVAVDDYVCLVTGSCVPEVDEAYTDYVIQHAVVATKRRLGEPSSEDFAELKELEEELLKAWASREQSHRVRKGSKAWVDSTGLIHRRNLS